jgi:DNA uptake protein ComE-like DNA-binding protein
MTSIAGDRQLKSGQQLRVTCTELRNPQMVVEPMSAAARLALGLRLDLNQASLADLTLIPGMKPSWAEVIVARRSRQPWRRLDDLQEIPGVGSRIVAKWVSFLDLEEEGDLP